MALEGVTLNEMSQPETDQRRVVPLTCGLSKRLDSQKQQDRGRRVLGWGQWERSGKGYKLSVMKKVEGLMYHMTTIQSATLYRIIESF